MNRFARIFAQGLLVAVAVAQPIDIWTTNRALAAAAGAIEGNPVEALLMHALGPAWWLPKAALGLFFLAYAVKLPTDRLTVRQWGLLSAVAKVYVLTLVSNFWHLI